IDRKALLRQLLSGVRGHLRYGDHIVGRGTQFFSQACALGLEGIISKRREAPYGGGRSASWLKIKCLLRQEFVIIGFTDLKGNGTGIGALLLGTREEPGSPMQFAGKVGTGFDRSSREDLRDRLTMLEQTSPTIDGSIAPTRSREVHWVTPELVAEVAFTGWTEEGRVRHASFQGLREDKRAADVVKERPMSVAKETAVKKRVRLTNPDRVLFPDDGITKRELADYWKSIATTAMPYIGNRPLSLVRCPDGIEHQCFYQKHIGAGVPEAIPGVAVNAEGDTYAMIDGVQALRGLAQIAAIELHCWGSRADDLDRPDVIVFDLDPSEEVDWPAVAEASLEMKMRLEALGLVAFAKVTGGKGVHVVSPIEPGPKWSAVKRFTRVLAREIAGEQSDRYTDSMSKSKRVGKIFIDYLRNDRESTSIGAYSPRARAGAPVAMPVEWTQLENPGGSPPRFGMKNVPEHIRTRDRDPWEAYEESRRSLTD
ncbi:MAG: DNA ligase D, partial [Thermomicrobiales bacterium]